MSDFTESPAFDVGRKVELRGEYSWFVILKTASDKEEDFEDFTATLTALFEGQVRVVSAMNSSIEDLVEALRTPNSDPVVITGLDEADGKYWTALDINRSGLQRPGAIILWLSSEGLTRLCQFAPNIRSFVGGSIFQLATENSAMTEEERNQRIAELESHFGLTSAQVIEKAKEGTLPVEPHFVEWLVFLDRGDLV